jgi:hypothetical protein
MFLLKDISEIQNYLIEDYACKKKKNPKKTEQLILKKLSLNKEILSCKKKSDKVI